MGLAAMLRACTKIEFFEGIEFVRMPTAASLAVPAALPSPSVAPSAAQLLFYGTQVQRIQLVAHSDPSGAAVQQELGGLAAAWEQADQASFVAMAQLMPNAPRKSFMGLEYIEAPPAPN